jgi:uncharacterized protein with von Willebrand factor type A (vWA) domain
LSCAAAPRSPPASLSLPKAAEPFVGFGRLLRRHGHPIAPDQVKSFLEAVTLLGPRSMDDIREAALATLAPAPDRRDAFEALFRSHFFGEAGAPVAEEADEETRVKDDAGSRERQAQAVRREKGGALSSAAEQLANRSFDADAETAGLARFARLLPASLPVRRSFRSVRTRSRGAVDLRRSLRAIAVS